MEITQANENQEATATASKMTPIRFGFDGKRAAKNLTGLGNYSRWLVGSLATLFSEYDFLVYTPEVKKSPRITAFFAIKNIFLKKPVNAAFLWRSLGILKDLARDKIQIYHGLSHELPFAIQHTQIKSVVTIHDLIFLRYPQHYRLFDRLIYKMKSAHACRHANKIIAISEKTRQDIIEFYGSDPDKIEVIYQSCDASFKISATPEAKLHVKQKLALPEKYILYVGTIESRKNLVALVTALKDVDPAYKLVVVGRKTKYFKSVQAVIEKFGLSKRVLIFENIDFADLPSVYQQAALFVLPSYYEGFGIPVIEALYSGTPVIAATGSCLEEAGGPDSKYIHPDAHDELAHIISYLLENPEETDRMREKGRAYVQKFDSDKLVLQTMACYQRLL